MQQVKINSVVKLYTLCLLSNGPKHGYELIKQLKTRMNQSISASHVYPFLKSLEENRFIACQSIEKRDKKMYVLTKNGEEFVTVVFNKFGGVIESVIEKKISICTHCRCKVFEGRYSETIKNKERDFCCEHCAKAFKEEMLLNV